MFFLLLLLAALAACDRAAMDPSLLEEHRAAARGAPNTLPVLFNEALRTAQHRLGEDALNAALATWESRQAEVQAAYAARDPAAVQAKLQALRTEEIGFVIRVLGDEVVTRALSEANVALADARRRIMEAAQQGARVASAEASAAEISQLLSRATALVAADPAASLQVVTEAARLLASIDDTIIELRRLRGVEALFPEVAAQLRPEELRGHARLQGEAQTALRNGQRDLAGQKLEAVRAEEIRLVLKATENRASVQLLGQVASSIGELRNSIRALDENDADAMRLERMLATAHDLHQQARTAEATGDHATALDLGSHAAGLLNSMRHLLVQ